MCIKASIVAYAILVQYYENTTIVAYMSLGINLMNMPVKIRTL